MRAPRAGRYDAATVYDARSGRSRARASPRTRCRACTSVDLDGARAGSRRNGAAVRAIVARGRRACRCSSAAGCATSRRVESAFATGVDRVVLGTAALRDPGARARRGAPLPGRIAVGLDAKDGRVAVEGWLAAASATVIEVASASRTRASRALVHTDIARDGMLAGPNLERERRSSPTR